VSRVGESVAAGSGDGSDGAEYANERGTAGAIRRTINQMNSDWDDVSFVISSQYRIAVLRRLADGPATPSRIANDADLGIAHISRALQGLRERNLVELLVSEDRRKGRVYGITEKGGNVWQKIEAENMV
jgi:DNA-binding MarR family transcriptional regulator